MGEHDEIYDEATLYELAFSYRNYQQECAFLLEAFRRWGSGGRLERYLELAAGPAAHALELASQGVNATALDLSAAMVAHGQRAAAQRGVPLRYLHADMTDFAADEPHQLAACLLDSASYLRTNDAFLSHLACVARALEPGGIYVLELAHPAELIGTIDKTERTWTVPSDRGTLTVGWGRTGAYDPLTQCAEVEVTMELASPDGTTQRTLGRGQQRIYTANEIDALVRASGAFDLVALCGALDADAPLRGSDESWRMVPVLRRREHTGTR